MMSGHHVLKGVLSCCGVSRWGVGGEVLQLVLRRMGEGG